MIQSRSRSEMRPAAKSLCACQDRSATSVMATAWESLCRLRLRILGRVDRFPFALDDPCPNLCRGLSFGGLLERVEIFVNTSSASGTVLAGETVQKTFVPLASVA